jgi:hypothetical protein
MERRRRFQRRIACVKSDQTLPLLSASLLIFVLSLFLPLASVHNYCENRTVAALFGVVSVTVSLLLIRNCASSPASKAASGVGKTLCILAVAVNVAFIVYATHLCRHMFDQLR